MNKKIAIIIITLFTTLNTLQAQSTKVEIYFKNGDTIVGYGKIKGDYLKFRKSYKEKRSKIHFSNLDRVKIYYSNESVTYVYRKVKGIDSSKVLEQVAIGSVNLYKRVVSGYSHGFVGGGFNGGFGNPGFGMGHSYNIKDYYVQKNTETEVIHLGSNQLFFKNFKKAASDFFKDCPQLVKKIQYKELKKRDLIEIVEFYNFQCN